MGLFGFFGSSKKSEATEIDRIFEKLSRFIRDDNFQNAVLPATIRNRILAGRAVDEIPGVRGSSGVL